MATVLLQNGGRAEIYFADDMWRSNLNNTHFCSQTLEALIRCISELGSSVIPELPEEPLVPEVDRLFKVLKNGSLEEKQKARRLLADMSRSGDQTATGYLLLLPTYNPSWEAKFYTKQTGKRDFRDVSAAELHEHVYNVVLRSKLIAELSNLLEVGLC